MYTHEDVITPIIMHCKVSTLKAIEFRSKLGFKQNDILLSKEQSVTSKIIKAFSKNTKKTLIKNIITTFCLKLQNWFTLSWT